MCKNKDCGCGCPSCGTAKDHSKRIQSTASESSEYSKLVSEDFHQSQSPVMQSGNSGYSKKSGANRPIPIQPSEYSSKETPRVVPTPEKFVSPGCAASPITDNAGFCIAGVGLLLLLSIASQINGNET